MPVLRTVETKIHPELWAEMETSLGGGIYVHYRCRICDAPIGIDKFTSDAPRAQLLAHVENCISKCGVLCFTVQT